MPRLVSLSVLVTLIIILGITFFRVIAPFLLPLFLAGVAAVLCKPIFDYFLKKTQNRASIAAGLTTTAVLLIVLVPIGVGVTLASLQIYTFAIDQLDADQAKRSADFVREKLDAHEIAVWLDDIVPGLDAERVETMLLENTQTLIQTLSDRSLGVATGVLGFAARGILDVLITTLVGGFMFAIALYYFLADGPQFLESAERLIPVHVQYQHRLVDQFNKVVRAVVVSTFVAAIAQAVLTAVLLLMVGFGQFFLLLVLSTFSALIPLAGTWVVWGPCAIWLMIEGSWGAAIFVVIIGVVVISTLDNVIRTYILNTDAKLHPLLALISVLGGLQVMGLWGVFIGPIVASILHGLMVIFNEELKAAGNLNAERGTLALADGPGPGPATTSDPTTTAPPETSEESAASEAQPTTPETDSGTTTTEKPNRKRRSRRNKKN